MHYPENGTSAYWMKGELKKRIDRFTVAKKSGFRRNRFMVRNISVIDSWGDLCTIPETLTINLSKNTAWTLTEEVELLTTEEDQAIMFNLGDICNIDNDNNDKTDNMSNDYVEMSTITRKIQSSIQHPSGTVSRSNTIVGMAQKDLMRALIRTDG